MWIQLTWPGGPALSTMVLSGLFVSMRSLKIAARLLFQEQEHYRRNHMSGWMQMLLLREAWTRSSRQIEHLQARI